GLITGAACPFPFALRHLMYALAGAYACWAVGGLAGMALATLSPEFFRRNFIRVPGEFAPMLAYAWVGGSIWGAQLGGVVSVTLGLAVLRANWRREQFPGPDS